MLRKIQFLTIFLCLLLHPLLTISSSFRNSSTQHLCHCEERLSLLQFKSGFSVGYFPVDECLNLPTYYAKTRSWMGSTDCCFWDGVTCDLRSGHVIGIDLSCSKLNGTIHPNSTLFHLRHLKTLNLAFNYFSSTPISPKFGRFGGLKLLNLSYSGFTGKVPLEIAQLSQLVSLDLSISLSMHLDKSKMESSLWEHLIPLISFPLEISGDLEMPNLDQIVRNLTDLRELNLNGVKVNSILPQTIANLSSLSTLQINFCNLQGPFSSDILMLPKLQTFTAVGNPNLQVDATKFYNLSVSLRELDFTSTNLSGQLPDIVGSPPPLLREFKAVNCHLHGAIPTWIWNTTEDIQLGINSLSGKIPTSLNLKELSKLNRLGLSENLLTGKIPSWVWRLPLLTSLQLDSNQFTGKLDGTLLTGNNSSLELIDLSMNNISVEFNLFSEMKNLTFLYLSHTNLSFISSITTYKLLRLRLSSCNLSEFPYFLKSQHSLGELDLSENRIQRDVPAWFQDVGKNSLYLLNISYNNLTGVFDLLPWKNLFLIDLRSNALQGPLPLLPPFILEFLASNNQFHGKISSSFCNLTVLEAFDVSYNNLNGRIPKCLGNLFSRVKFLNLRSNKLQGAINVKFADDCNLGSIHLNNNQFGGSLPRTMVRCTALEVIDLGNNQFNDTFPHWLNALPDLQVLVLQSNKFRGTIRSHRRSKHQFPKLQILDLSSNQFYGKLPESYIKKFKGMMFNNGGAHNRSRSLYLDNLDNYHDSLVLTVKGSSLTFKRILNILTILDLSNNNFSCEIPDSLGQLVALSGLNLSHNHLTGHIPASLANISSLEFLDLSWNVLERQIPQQLARLTFLGTFNVSQNQLTGLIPQGNQFNTFSSNSYKGNPGLCGYPLPRCGRAFSDAPPNPRTPMSQQDDLFDFTSISLWKVILMGVGVGINWGFVGGCCMISSGKPVCLSKKVDRMEYVILQRSRKHYRKRARRN